LTVPVSENSAFVENLSETPADVGLASSQPNEHASGFETWIATFGFESPIFLVIDVDVTVNESVPVK
jgi:hypothetical protein